MFILISRSFSRPLFGFLFFFAVFNIPLLPRSFVVLLNCLHGLVEALCVLE